MGRPPQWDTTGYGQQAGGTHPTGMHSCLNIILLLSCIRVNESSLWSVLGLKCIIVIMVVAWDKFNDILLYDYCFPILVFMI